MMATPAVIRVVEREARVFSRLWRGIVFSAVVNPLCVLVAIGFGLGSIVDTHSGNVGGVPYLDFVAPGVLVAAAAQVAAGEALWPVLAGVKWIRFFEGVAASPITPSELCAGYLLWVALRTTLIATTFLIVAAALGAVSSVWGILAIPAASLTALALAAPLSAFAITQTTDLAFPVIMRLGVLPLFLFSGTFFPITQLPPALRALAAFSPIWHGVALARDATTGTGSLPSIVFHLAALAAFIAVGFAFGRRTFTRRLAA
jgi:lipooligosaccharide transport system permease protein